MTDLLNFYGLTQPGYEDLDMLEPLSDANYYDELVATPTHLPDGTAPVLRRHVPSGDIWRYRILPFCDLVTLLQLNHTNRLFRAVLNDPHFVVEWQSRAWFLLRRGCHCERHQFYLNTGEYLDFAWDCLGIQTSRASEVALKSMGRCTNLELAPAMRLSNVDPRRNPKCFMPGLLDVWFENWIVPMPRMLLVPVEDAHCSGTVPSTYWRHCHAIPEEHEDGDGSEPRDPDADLELPMEARPGFRRETYFAPRTVDLVHEYREECRVTGRDPHDPNQDNVDCLGYRSVRWARRRLYETAVGIQTYPLVHCLRKSDLTGRAARDGVDYLDTLFLPAHRSFSGRGETECAMLTHRGPIYFHPLRYNNERGDFVPWALSTLALLQSVYVHAWYDSIHHIIQRMDEFARQVANETEATFSFYRMTERWNYLHHVCWMGQTPMPGLIPRSRLAHPPDAVLFDSIRDRLRAQDQAALNLLYDPHYVIQNRWMNNLVLTYERAETVNHEYLTSLLPDGGMRHFAAQRNEATLVQELRDLMQVTDYIVRFANAVGPMVDRVTERARERSLAIYLGAGTSLLMFSPAFRRTPTWNPSHMGCSAGSRVPHVNLQNNHRFRDYLRYLNRRALYYVSEPPPF